MDNSEKYTRGFDVIMPAYNKAEFIRESVQSILDQTFNDFRLIIVDDGSIDNTTAIINEFQDHRIHLIIHKENKGVAAAMNTGLTICDAKYVARMDADDISDKDRLASHWLFMESHPDVDFSSGLIQYFGTRDDMISCYYLPEEIKNYVLFRTTVYQGAAVWRSSFLKKFNLKLNEFVGNVGEDWEFWVRCCEYGKGGNIDKVLLYYRQHEFNISGGKNTDYYEKRIRAVREIFRIKKWPEKYVSCHFIFQKIFPFGIDKKICVDFLEWCDYLINWAKNNPGYSDAMIKRYIDEKKKEVFYVIADFSPSLALFYKRKSGIKLKGYLAYILKAMLKGKKSVI